MKKEEKGKFKNVKRNSILFFIFFLLIGLGVLAYSHFIVPKRLDVKEYRIVGEQFKNIHGYKIAHVSDIHFGKTTTMEDLKKLVEKINATKPNILFFTGDLIDKKTTLTEKRKEEIENVLGTLDETIIKYAIKGEDDYLFPNYDFIMENAGFISLDNTYKILYMNQSEYLFLAGLSSTKNKESLEEAFDKVKEYTNALEEKPLYSILLLHEPDFASNIDLTNFNLILAGHSHGGQIKLPFIGGIKYPKYAQKYHQDKQIVQDRDFYVSSGIGTTTYGFRLFNNPSFNLYRLVSY